MVMPKVIKTIFILFAVWLLAFPFSPLPWAEPGRIELEFKGQTFSACLKNVPLIDIFEKVRQEKGVWFKGKASLFEETVSVEFNDFPIQDGLKRILSRMNYSFIFGRDHKLLGVILLEKSHLIHDGERSYSESAAMTLPIITPEMNRRRPPPPQ